MADAHVTENSSSSEIPTTEQSNPSSNEREASIILNGIQRNYQSRKPKWWRQLSGKATKGQRRGMAEMQSHRLKTPAYREFFQFDHIFGRADPKVGVEIGFGSGHNLLCLAQKYPDIYWIGSEIHKPGLGKVYLKIREGIRRKALWTGYTIYREKLDPAFGGFHPENVNEKDEWIDTNEPLEHHPYSNLRLCGDGVKILPYLDEATVDLFLVTFPDPFPKEHQQRWRIFQTSTVKEMRRALKQNGKLFLATDDERCFQWAQDVVDRVNAESECFARLLACPPRQEWLPCVSQYELQGWAEGRETNTICWEAIG
jgi:tRNA G46 methylase TrmB